MDDNVSIASLRQQQNVQTRVKMADLIGIVVQSFTGRYCPIETQSLKDGGMTQKNYEFFPVKPPGRPWVILPHGTILPTVGNAAPEGRSRDVSITVTSRD
jgi:hypothetical protein